MAKQTVKPTPAKCRCNPGFGILAVILFAVGLWALAAGNVTILGWYFAGFLLLGVGKIAKWKGCGSCGTHCGTC